MGGSSRYRGRRLYKGLYLRCRYGLYLVCVRFSVIADTFVFVAKNCCDISNTNSCTVCIFVKVGDPGVYDGVRYVTQSSVLCFWLYCR